MVVMKKLINKLVGLRQSKGFIDYVCYADPILLFGDYMNTDELILEIKDKFKYHIAMCSPFKKSEYSESLVEAYQWRRSQIQELYGFQELTRP